MWSDLFFYFLKHFSISEIRSQDYKIVSILFKLAW